MAYKLMQDGVVVAQSKIIPVYDPLSQGWLTDTGIYSDSGRTLTVLKTTMTPVRFRAQFPIMAKVKIKRARAYVDGSDTNAEADERKAFARDVLDELFKDLDDVRVTEIDVDDTAVIGGVQFVRSLEIIDDDEAAQILHGIEVE